MVVPPLACRECLDNTLAWVTHSRFSLLGLLSGFSGLASRGRLASLSSLISANNRSRNGKSSAGSSFDMKKGRPEFLNRTHDGKASPTSSLLRLALSCVTGGNAQLSISNITLIGSLPIAAAKRRVFGAA